MKELITKAIKDYEKSIQIVKDTDLLSAWTKCRSIGTIDGLCLYFKINTNPVQGNKIMKELNPQAKEREYWWLRPDWQDIHQTISALERRLTYLQEAYDRFS